MFSLFACCFRPPNAAVGVTSNEFEDQLAMITDDRAKKQALTKVCSVTDLPTTSTKINTSPSDDSDSRHSDLCCGTMPSLPAVQGPDSGFNLCQSAAPSFKTNTGVVANTPNHGNRFANSQSSENDCSGGFMMTSNFPPVDNCLDNFSLSQSAATSFRKISSAPSGMISPKETEVEMIL